MKTLKEIFTNAIVNKETVSQILGGTGITDPDLSGAAADIDITDPDIDEAPRNSSTVGG